MTSAAPFLVNELRVAWLQLKGAQVDLRAVASALQARVINPDKAVGILCGCNLLDLLGIREDTP
jgi:hypothetical protein